MRREHWTVFLVSGVLLAMAGCATSQEWETWKSHPSHFASRDHLLFSVRNTENATPRVTRHDLALGREQGWWGKPVTVTQDQLLER